VKSAYTSRPDSLQSTSPEVRETDARITEELVYKVMGWKSAPGRFLKAGRGWLPKWRFAPFVRIEDAFELLDRSACAYRIEGTGSSFAVNVESNDRTGRASDERKARAITTALARALGIEQEANP